MLLLLYLFLLIFLPSFLFFMFFFFNDTATTEIYTLSLHDALPISLIGEGRITGDHEEPADAGKRGDDLLRSEEHTSELQSHLNLVCRLLLEKKKSKVRLERSRPVIYNAKTHMLLATVSCPLAGACR